MYTFTLICILYIYTKQRSPEVWATGVDYENVAAGWPCARLARSVPHAAGPERARTGSDSRFARATCEIDIATYIPENVAGPAKSIFFGHGPCSLIAVSFMLFVLHVHDRQCLV